MANMIMRHVVKRIFSRNNIPRSFGIVKNVIGIRFLYSFEHLGIDRYLEQRDRIRGQFGEMKEKFQTRMHQYIANEGSLVFTEDLKSVIHLVDDNPEELDMCIKMMKRFNQQNKELRFGAFVFGPVVMRLLCFLNKPDLAFQILEDKELQGFFDQIPSYLIAMNILYINGEYQKVIDLYEQLKEKQISKLKHPKDCVVLTLASCYKINTPESYKYALDLLTSAREVGAMIVRKGLAFTAALALNQNDPKIAMEVLSLVHQYNYITVKNLKIIALADLQRLDDVFMNLKSVVGYDVPSHMNFSHEICQCTLDRIQRVIEKLDDKESAHIFEQISRALKENNHITKQTLDELLCTPVQYKPVLDPNRGQGSMYSSYRRPGRFTPHSDSVTDPASNKLSFQRRQGLTDID